MTATVGAFVLTAGVVAHATGGRLAGGAPDRVFETVSIDSRSLDAGALFIALRGDRFDGHAFVEDAIRRGAAGVLVSSAPSASAVSSATGEAAAVIVVPDTLEALQQLGRDVRRLSGALVIAITGSTGKTSTKEVTAEFLSERYRVYRNRGNLNNHVGLPLSLLELRSGPDVAVVELGMNHAGEIHTLVGIAEPDVRVWTNVGDAHLGHFVSRDALGRAKAELLDLATPKTKLVANADDRLVMAHAARFIGRVVTFGEGERADVRATNVADRGFDGTEADVRTSAGRGRLSVPLAGRAQLSNVLAGIAVAVELGVSWDAIAARASQLRPVARRGAVRDLPQGIRLVDDSYNASPAAMRAMLAALGATPTAGRRVAVLGEMLELGDAARSLHENCGHVAVVSGVEELVVIGGPDADGLVDGARDAGLASMHIHRYADSAAAAPAVAALVKRGDLVLVKGSRGTRTDLVADRLMAGGAA